MKKIFTLGIPLLFSVSVAAQIKVSTDLKNAIDRALEKDATIKNQNIELVKLHNERKSVLNKYIPKVEATALYSYFDNDITVDIPTLTVPIIGNQLFDGSQKMSSYGNVFHGGITAKTVLFSGGQILNGARALEAKTEGTSLMMNSEEDRIIKEVISSFDNIKLLNAAKKLIEESEQRLNKEQERVEKAIALGLAIPYDRDKIKLAALELKSKKIDVENKQKLLFQKIEQLTGIAEMDIAEVDYSIDAILILEDLSSENRNELRALEAFKRASEFAIKKEKGSLLPTLGAFGSYSYTSVFNAGANIPVSAFNTSLNLRLDEFTLHPNWMFGLALKWELFSGFERKHKIEEARLNLEQIENKLTDTKEKLQLLLQKNKADYEALLSQVDIAIQKEKIAINNVTMAQKQYKEGLINITERLTAETDIYQQSLNKIEILIKQRAAAIETYSNSGPLYPLLTIE